MSSRKMKYCDKLKMPHEKHHLSTGQSQPEPCNSQVHNTTAFGEREEEIKGFMEKIKNYIEKFFNKHKMNIRYALRMSEIFALKECAKENPLAAFNTAFDYGYAKGYRAALAEMKKGGVA